MAEDQLLDALNKTKGEILENDDLIQKLESLKQEAAEIAEAVAKTDETLEEIKEVTNEYGPLAMMTTRIFFTLESMSIIHYLYQYSLQHFMDVVFDVLNENEEVKKIPKTEPQRRLQVIIKQLFLRVNSTIGYGLLDQHTMLFTLRLAQIRVGDDAACEPLFALFLSSPHQLEPNRISAGLLRGKLSKSQLAQLEDISLGPHVKGLLESMEQDEARWLQVLESAHPEQNVPEPWMTGDDVSTLNETARFLKKLIVIKIIRPDRL